MREQPLSVSMDRLIHLLRRKGCRLTRARRAILRYFLKNPCSLSIQELRDRLKKEGLRPDLSTLYRELQFLTKQEITTEISFHDGIRRYELRGTDHHHHLVCTSCNSVEAVDMAKDLEGIERTIQKRRQFRIHSHSLEFYGLCQNCQR